MPAAVFSTVSESAAGPNLMSTVRLEEVTVISVQDRDGLSKVVLKAARIGATYFQNNPKTGVRTVNGKTGYDFRRQQSWTAF